MVTGMRFSPPRVEISAEIKWLLSRAFGPLSIRDVSKKHLDANCVVDLGERLDLLPRVASRTPSSELTADLGEDCAGLIRDAATEAAARSLVVEAVCRELADLNPSVESPLIVLKGAALQIGGWVDPGSRNMIDLDVLVAEDAARTLQKELVRRGYLVAPFEESDHQLPCLTHRSGLAVEIHLTIPGLRVGGEGFTTADDLIEAGLVVPALDAGEGVFLPDKSVLLAHVLVHGFSQHGFVPGSYPFSRMIADVQDLQIESAGWEAFLVEEYRWIEREVTRSEVNAVAELVRLLGEGEPAAAIADQDDGAAAMLLHLIAGATDDGYGRALRIRNVMAHPREGGALRRLASEMAVALWPTRGQIDVIYGQPKSELGYVGRRLWRPFDLVGRACRYGWAAARHRLRRR